MSAGKKKEVSQYYAELKRIRKVLGMTQEEFAAVVFKDKNGYRRKQYISDLENGRRAISISEVERIAKSLGCLVMVRFVFIE